MKQTSGAFSLSRQICILNELEQEGTEEERKESRKGHRVGEGMEGERNRGNRRQKVRVALVSGKTSFSSCALDKPCPGQSVVT